MRDIGCQARLACKARGETGMPLTRRALIARVAAVGGYRAAYAAMGALGLLTPGRAHAANTQESYAALPTAQLGKGARVVVIGAGIGGLVSAFELRKAGFQVTVLEAR